MLNLQERKPRKYLEPIVENAFIRKLAHFTHLSEEDRGLLTFDRHQRSLKAGREIIREGERPTTIKFILSGWAYRYKQLENGRRQIVALFLPGDLCDLNIFILRKMDHSVGTLTDVTYAELSRSEIEDLTLTRPQIADALWWDTLVTSAIQREWTTNIGQRHAFERVSHLFCELYCRLGAIGLTKNGSCDLPLTQAELGEATGLTSVHVNRTLKEMRAANLITLYGKRLTILNWEKLRNAAMFNGKYLHLNNDGAHLDPDQ